MKKSFRKLLADASLLSMLSLAPVSKAEKTIPIQTLPIRLVINKAILKEDSQLDRLSEYNNTGVNYNTNNDNTVENDKGHEINAASVVCTLTGAVSALGAIGGLELFVKGKVKWFGGYDVKINRLTSLEYTALLGILSYYSFKGANEASKRR